MDLTRMKELAGLPVDEKETIVMTEMLNEATVIDDTTSLDQIAAMMDGARRGLGLANKLTDPVMKKKHLRAIFINMNKIRAAIARHLRDMDVTDDEVEIAA